MPTVLVTGANRGLGLEFTRQYAGDGWRVYATCRDPDGAAALQSVAGDVSVHRLDVGAPDQVVALARDLDGTPIDVLLNSAGVYGPRSYGFGDIDYDAWVETLRINTLSPLRVAEAFVGNVAASGQKKLVAVSSKVGSIGDNSGGGGYIYRSSKAALNAAMKSLALDLAGRDVVSCVLHPGWVRTDMGGSGGLIDAPESVTGMRAVIDRLDAATSGRFFNYDGAEIPW